MTYDLDNRIYKIKRSGKTTELKYDALGRRVFRKRSTADKSPYLWWGDQEVSEHRHRVGQATIQNDLWAHPTRLNTIYARALEGDKFDIQYYHKNYLDHVLAVSDDNGQILEHYAYSAYGEVEIYSPSGSKRSTSDIDNEVLWNSRRYDADTGLYYYKYRHYSPQLGKWPARDPIEEWGGVNLYAFVGNEPIWWWDRLGLYYSARVKALFTDPSLCCEIFKAAKKFNVDIVALVMAMADEHQAYDATDAAQDALALASGDDKPLGLGRGDLGPFNLHIDTAMDMLQKYGTAKGKKRTRKQAIVDVLTAHTAVPYAAAAMSEVHNVLGNMPEVSDHDYVGHLVQGWRQGPENRKKAMKEAKKKGGDDYKPDHGMNDYDERVKEIKEILKKCGGVEKGK